MDTRQTRAAANNARRAQTAGDADTGNPRAAAQNARENPHGADGNCAANCGRSGGADSVNGGAENHTADDGSGAGNNGRSGGADTHSAAAQKTGAESTGAKIASRGFAADNAAERAHRADTNNAGAQNTRRTENRAAAVRAATPGDLAQILRVESASFIPLITESGEVFAERIKKCPESFFVFTDGEDGRVFGYICAEKMDSVPRSSARLALGHTPRQSAAGTVLYISSFALLPEYRGRGLGGRLWRESVRLFSALPSVRTIILLVNEKWAAARKIYEDDGFRAVRTFPRFFPSENGTSAAGILMGKNIRTA